MGMRRSPLNTASPASIRLPSPGSMPGASNSMPCFSSSMAPSSCTASNCMPSSSCTSSSCMPSSSCTSSSCMPSSNVVIDEATSDVPLISPFVIPKIEDESGMYSMNSMINERVSSIINDEAVSSLLEERGAPPMMNGGVAPLINQMGPENKFPTTNFMTNIKSDLSEINWMVNQSAPAPAPTYAPSEPSLENWLGQIFKSDNLTPGCSLPQPQQQGQVENVNFG